MPKADFEIKQFPVYCNNFVHKAPSFDNAFVYLFIINAA